jgi:peptidoglycan/xylan/chitin deacetylase (PgdA/CDA1 family)
MIRYHEISDGVRAAFATRGFRGRHFFAHHSYFLPIPGADALKLAAAMCHIDRPDALWTITLHAAEPALSAVPEPLYFDSDLVWHQEHYGMPGHVAFATLAVHRGELHVLNCVSDIVQRQGKRPEYSTRIDKVFRGWYHMLFNAILAFAAQHGVETVRVPMSRLVMRETDPRRSVEASLFERVYDGAAVQRYSPNHDGEWWTISVSANIGKVVVPATRARPAPTGKTLCVCHDIEHGLGHRGIDNAFAEAADVSSPDAVRAMLAIERDQGVRATYNVVGCLLDGVRGEIERDGHALGFHSYDHAIRRFAPVLRLRDSWVGPPMRLALRALRGRADRTAIKRGVEVKDMQSERGWTADQLRLCRAVDYRIRGYRPPQSRITPDASDRNLVNHNFKWLASSSRSLGIRTPVVRNGLVRIPIAIDDFDLYLGRRSYDDWRGDVLASVDAEPYAALSLHDCYGSKWLHDYSRLLEALQRRGPLVTLDQVAWTQLLLTGV